MANIAYQNKDVASKVTGETLVGRSLAPFGLPHVKIVGLLPTNLPAIESNELRLDNLFLLSDGSIAIIDYESEFKKENFVKYLNYIARVVKCYALQHKLEELHEIRMIVIYTADVEQAEEVYHLGSLTLIVESAYLVNMNSNHIYQKLRNKIESGEPLNEEEMTELMILPLTAKGNKKKQEYIEKVVQLAKMLSNTANTHTILSGLLTFTDKIIDKKYAAMLKEELFMLTQVEQLFLEDMNERVRIKVQEQVQQKVQEQIQAQLPKLVQEQVQQKVQEQVQQKVQEQVQQKVQENTAFMTNKHILAAIQMCKDLGIEKSIALHQIVTNFSIDEPTARKWLNANWT